MGGLLVYSLFFGSALIIIIQVKWLYVQYQLLEHNSVTCSLLFCML